jgi:tetratricopeptide (TPR) repeat protein
MSLKIIFPAIFFLLPLMVFSQVKDQQLADQYFYGREYDKAVTLYEKLYDKNPFVYNNYLRSLFELNQTDKAEKLVKKQIKKDPRNPVLLIDLGQVYFRKNNSADARKQYESALKMLPADQTVIINTANAFMAIREQDFALQTYLEGRKLLRGAYTFRFELAQVYFLQQNYQSMLEEYIGALEENPGYLQNVQNMLQSRLNNEK